MAFSNKWVGYLTRTYQQGKEQVLDYLGSLVPELSDHSESNPFVKILSVWWGITEMLGYYIDNRGRESHLVACRLYRSGVMHAQAADYRVHLWVSASGDVTFILYDSDGNVAPAPSIISIPKGTRLRNSVTEIDYFTVETCRILVGETEVTVGIRQGVEQDYTFVGNANGLADCTLNLNLQVAEETFAVQVDGDTYETVDTFGYSKPTDRHCMITVNKLKQPVIIFGDDINGVIPTGGAVVTVNGAITVGSEGDTSSTTIDTIVDTVAVPPTYTLGVTNKNEVSGGNDLETLAQLKNRIPKANRTKLRAVTTADYVDLADTFSGVGKAGVHFECGKKVTLYIVPVGGGLASSVLLSDVEDFFEDKRMVTTNVVADRAGIVYMDYNIDVRVLPNYNRVDTGNAVKAAILAFHAISNQEIDGSVQIGNIYQTVEETEGVDYSTVNRMTPTPYPQIKVGVTALNWSSVAILPASTTKTIWILTYMGGSLIQVIKDADYMGTYAIGVLVSFAEWQFQVDAGLYSVGDEWRVVVYPYTGSLDLDEPSVPATEIGRITLNLSGGL